MLTGTLGWGSVPDGSPWCQSPGLTAGPSERRWKVVDGKGKASRGLGDPRTDEGGKPRTYSWGHRH